MKKKPFPLTGRHIGTLCLCVVLIASGAPPVAAQQSVADTVRFLEQATFGPTPELITRVQQIGFQAYLNEQFALPINPEQYPDLPFWPQGRPAAICAGSCQRNNYTYYQLTSHFFWNALYEQDQLRQRVAWALSQIEVTSGVDVPLPSWMAPYQRLLYDGAFGNFRDLLYNITLNPAMGRFLDMLDNRCQTPSPPNVDICANGRAVRPNENFARELLQLFSIGTLMLNQDGTLQRNAQGNPIPAYSEETLQEFARALTGWILEAQLPGPPEVGGNVPNYRDPMRVFINAQDREGYHDKGPKTLLNGLVLPGGQTAQEELDLVIDNIFTHSNVAPFIGKLLIQNLVTSNPSPAYVGRVAGVFRDNGAGVRGDLRAVVQAILLDPEARGDVRMEPNYGHLREPVLFMLNLLRAFNAQSADQADPSDGVLNNLSLGGGYLIGSQQMDQNVFRAPTVFNYYQPDYEVPGAPAGTLGPEFGIHSSLNALRRHNFVQRIVFSNIPATADPENLNYRPNGTSIDLTPYENLAGNPQQLVETLNTLLMHGSMSNAMRNIVMNAVTGIPDSSPLLRAQTAIYLIATSSQYQVER